MEDSEKKKMQIYNKSVKYLTLQEVKEYKLQWNTLCFSNWKYFLNDKNNAIQIWEMYKSTLCW